MEKRKGKNIHRYTYVYMCYALKRVQKTYNKTNPKKKQKMCFVWLVVEICFVFTFVIVLKCWKNIPSNCFRRPFWYKDSCVPKKTTVLPRCCTGWFTNIFCEHQRFYSDYLVNETLAFEIRVSKRESLSWFMVPDWSVSIDFTSTRFPKHVVAVLFFCLRLQFGGWYISRRMYVETSGDPSQYGSEANPWFYLDLDLLPRPLVRHHWLESWNTRVPFSQSFRPEHVWHLSFVFQFSTSRLSRCSMMTLWSRCTERSISKVGKTTI
jgi:hypothetical protein